MRVQNSLVFMKYETTAAVLPLFSAARPGIFVSALTMDWDKGVTVAVLIMNTFLLLGGFYVKNIPGWLLWLKIISPISNSYSIMLRLEFTSDERFL